MEEIEGVDNVSVFYSGKKVEQMLSTETEMLQKVNHLLEAKILQWYYLTKDETFASYFEIKVK